MSDSEEDYMSEAILAKCEDKRPGILPERLAKQYKKQERIKEINKKNNTKPLKVLEQEKRSEGLSKAIGEGNKGFALLQKMGYKAGMTLGKKGTGRAEPVPINLRTGRAGLGTEAERKRKQEEKARMRSSMREKRMKREAENQNDYRQSKSRMRAEREAECDLYKSQRVCEQLDEAKGITLPSDVYFWTPAKMALLKKQREKDASSSSSDDDDDDDDVTDTPVGFHFTDDSDTKLYEKILNADDKKSNSEDEEDELPSTSEQLEKLTHYLRSQYFYCLWCGTQYDDSDDLISNCPGDTAGAHDT